MSRNIAGRSEDPTFVHVISEQGFTVLQSQMLVIINHKSKLEIGNWKKIELEFRNKLCWGIKREKRVHTE